MNKQDTELVINTMTGVITFRNEENDAQVTSFPISRRHATMIENGEISAANVCAAIKAKMMANEKFSFDEYAEGLRRLNMRKSALHIDPPKVQLSDRSDEMVDDSDIEKAAKETETAESEKAVEEAPVKRRSYTRRIKADEVKIDDSDIGVEK